MMVGVMAGVTALAISLVTVTLASTCILMVAATDVVMGAGMVITMAATTMAMATVLTVMDTVFHMVTVFHMATALLTVLHLMVLQSHHWPRLLHRNRHSKQSTATSQSNGGDPQQSPLF